MVWAAVMDNLLIEVRYVADDSRQSPGRLAGTLLTYGETARDRAERFIAGALRWGADGITINQQHVRANVITRAVPYLEGNEVKIDALLPNTTIGRDTAVNVREGILTGLSIEFEQRSLVERMVGGIREIRQATLVGAGLVDLASYAGSVVEIRQSDGGVMLPGAATLWL